MAQVYVRWYGNVVQGELLDEEYLGMKQVRIPLDGHHPIALFTPGHVYESVEKMQEVAKEVYSYPKEFPKPEDIIHHDLPCSYPADDYLNLEIFKRDNWDQEHNHLRIDKLDEFYWLWREEMRPFGFVEAEAVHESCTPSQQPKSHKPAAITKGYSEITSPYPAITQGYPEITQPYSKKTKKPQIVELSLFD